MTAKTSGKNEVPQGFSDDTPEDLRKLFNECSNNEKDLNLKKVESAKAALIRDWSFPAQFPSAPAFADPNSMELRTWRGDLYKNLTAELKSAGNDDTFWWLLARWLRTEGIREPDDVVPAEVLKRLNQAATVRANKLLNTDFYNVLLVRIWLPSTEPLLRKKRWLKSSGRNERNELKRVGYDSDALKVLLPRERQWESPVEFTCAWIEWRTRYNADTIRNSYSRVFNKTEFRRQDCFFCGEPAENEFWAYKISILHCDRHKADRLRTSEGEAWPDPFGYRWWREDLSIRRFKPS